MDISERKSWRPDDWVAIKDRIRFKYPSLLDIEEYEEALIDAILEALKVTGIRLEPGKCQAVLKFTIEPDTGDQATKYMYAELPSVLGYLVIIPDHKKKP